MRIWVADTPYFFDCYFSLKVVLEPGFGQLFQLEGHFVHDGEFSLVRTGDVI
jgi:hypothetical protein